MVIGIPALVLCTLRFLVLLLFFNFETPVALIHEHHEKTLNEFLHKVYKS
jgi:hypothetical protein